MAPPRLVLRLLLLGAALLAAAAGAAGGRLQGLDGISNGGAAAAAFAQPARSGAGDPRGASAPSPLPVVLWHGMGDSCCASYSIGAVKSLIESKLGVFVHSVATGEGEMDDVFSSYYGNVNDQVAHVCAQLRNLTQLQNGFNAVGFSQGGQFLRAVAERCGHTGPRMRTLVTLGAQHQGIMNVPGCRTLPLNSSHGTCHVMQYMLGKGAYLPFVRDHLVQAQYFKDPLRLDEYLKLSPFLPDINNERPTKNVQYAANLAALERLVLYRFTKDDMVVPRDSAWFSFFDGSQVVPLRQQAMYAEDWIGLKALDEAGRLQLEEVDGVHMQFSLEWFDENIVQALLATPGQPDYSAA